MRTFSFLKPPPCFTCVMNLPEHWSKTKIGGVNLLKKPVSPPPPPPPAWALSWQRAGRHLPRCYMSLKWLNCLLAPVLFFLPPRRFAGISRKFFPQIFNPRRDWQCCQTSGRVLRRYYKRSSVRGTLDYSRLCCNPFNPHCIKISVKIRQQ